MPIQIKPPTPEVKYKFTPDDKFQQPKEPIFSSWEWMILILLFIFGCWAWYYALTKVIF